MTSKAGRKLLTHPVILKITLSPNMDDFDYDNLLLNVLVKIIKFQCHGRNVFCLQSYRWNPSPKVRLWGDAAFVRGQGMRVVPERMGSVTCYFRSPTSSLLPLCEPRRSRPMGKWTPTGHRVCQGPCLGLLASRSQRKQCFWFIIHLIHVFEHNSRNGLDQWW